MPKNIKSERDYQLLYYNQNNARALIGQSGMVYCASKLMEYRASSELL